MITIIDKEGWELNPNDKVVNAILKRCEKLNGECPCHHEEWNENTPIEDKKCPCITFREKDECHCKLYVKKVKND